jgi:hypothetical protein
MNGKSCFFSEKGSSARAGFSCRQKQGDQMKKRGTAISARLLSSTL